MLLHRTSPHRARLVSVSLPAGNLSGYLAVAPMSAAREPKVGPSLT